MKKSEHIQARTSILHKYNFHEINTIRTLTLTFLTQQNFYPGLRDQNGAINLSTIKTINDQSKQDRMTSKFKNFVPYKNSKCELGEQNQTK